MDASAVGGEHRAATAQRFSQSRDPLSTMSHRPGCSLPGLTLCPKPRWTADPPAGCGHHLWSQGTGFHRPTLDRCLDSTPPLDFDPD